MSLRFRKPKGDIFWVTLLWFVLSGAGALVILRVGGMFDEVDLPFPTGVMLAFVLVPAVFGVLVWLGQRWVAIPAMGWYAVDAAGKAWFLATDTVTLRGVGKLCLSLWIIYVVFEWWHDSDKEDDEDDSDPPLAVVALLREPVFVDEAVVVRAAKRAWGAELTVGGDEDENADPDDPFAAKPESDDEDQGDGFVVGMGPMNVVMHNKRMLMVNSFSDPYSEDPAETADTIGDLRLKQAYAEHRAWLSCDVMGGEEIDDPAELRECYRLCGRMLHELVDDNCLAIFLPHEGRIFANLPETLEALLAEDPLAELMGGVSPPVIPIADDDPRMEAAAAEARQRFGEFTQAFEADAGENFSIKAPVSRAGSTEFIWIEVTAIENGVVYGTLGNDPVNLGSLKLGSRVRVPQASINDWCYVDASGEPVGLFTARVLDEARREREHGDD